ATATLTKTVTTKFKKLKQEKEEIDTQPVKQEIEMEEVPLLKRPGSIIDSEPPQLHHLKSSSPMEVDCELFIKREQSNRRNSWDNPTEADFAFSQYEDLLGPSMRPKAFTISTPSYLSHQIASLSALCPNLAAQYGITGSGLSPQSPNHTSIS